MAIKPILFNTEMVRAILDGRKTCTRRVIKHNTEAVLNSPYRMKHPEVEEAWLIRRLCRAPYEPGDIVYVRETWHKYSKLVGKGEGCHLEERYGYKASIANSEDAAEPWKPSIHMPREAVRIWLKVTDVRVERLHEITWKGALSEGCYGLTSDEPDTLFHIPTLRGDFRRVWNSTIKKSDLDSYGWNANPWVWVIEFERCEKPQEV